MRPTARCRRPSSESRPFSQFSPAHRASGFALPPQAAYPDSKLFVLLAVRSTEGLVDEKMRGWVEEVPFVTHMEVGELLPEAARELAILSTPGGRLPDDVLDYLVAHCEVRGSLLLRPCGAKVVFAPRLGFLLFDGLAAGRVPQY